MHPRVGWWSEQSIRWYERASGRCDFHRDLVSLIEPTLSKSDSIMEAGCGLGYEAEILRKKGYGIEAFDRDSSVIEAAGRRSGLDIFHCSDFESLDLNCDVLLCINFGHIKNLKDLGELLSHAGRRVVYIISRHSGHGVQTRADRSDLIDSLLAESGLHYGRKDFSLQFDQPLISVEEARAFLEWTYLNDRIEEYLKFVEKVEDKDFPYVFRNRKMMTQFVIDKA